MRTRGRELAHACDPRIHVITAVDDLYHAVSREMLRSLAGLGHSASIYHEDSRHAVAIGRARVVPGPSGGRCAWRELDLHTLFPWLASFASMRNGTAFASARLNAVQGPPRRRCGASQKGAPMRHLTGKSNRIFRKVLAIGHAVLAPPPRGAAPPHIALWADADIYFHAPLDEAWVRSSAAHGAPTPCTFPSAHC